MRLFTGIPIPSDLQGNLERLLMRLRPTAQLQWSPPYNFHITTKFIGEWPQERLGEIMPALQPLQQRPPLSLALQGLGWFPNPHHPKVFFAGIQAGTALVQLANESEAALAPLGVAVEDREYHPHLTLARVRRTVPLASLRQAVAALESVQFGQFTADHFCLYRSEPGPASSIYTALERFPFTAA